MHPTLRLWTLALLLPWAPATHAAPPPHPKFPASTPAELRAEKAFETARKTALTLHAFLERMPKGADLHMHLSGAIYAETFLRDAAEDGLCANPVTLSLGPNLGIKEGEPICLDPSVPAARALADQHLYDALVDSFSMRAFLPTPGTNGHDQFFATFARFSGIKSHNGEWLDEVATRAAAQNEQYLEVMMTPTFSAAAKLGARLGWPPGLANGASGEPASAANSANVDTPDPSLAEKDRRHAAFAGLRDRLLADGLREEVAIDRREIDDALAQRNRLEHCGAPDAHPGCAVTIRVIYQVLRANPPQQVFAQTLLGFEVAAADPSVVGINFVQPEDAYLAMTEYHRQMLMLDFLHGVYPRTHISLHAGELAPGLVPPDGLRFHIREAVELGHAERIGHGVDVMYEEHPEALLREMAARHVMAEINLTSNDVILGVKANEHSLPAYRAAGVPVALSTDDEGVSRIDLTHEYARAALDYNLSYLDLKKMARTALEHSFLGGAGLWAAPDLFTAMTPACATRSSQGHAGTNPGPAEPTPTCLDFLCANEKAAQQWELEHRFEVFESALPRPQP